MLNKFLVKRPIVTEKAVRFGKDNKYVFLADSKASASEVKKVVEATYNVRVVKTNVINVKGKQTSKKVIVTLQKGQKLDILPQ